MSPTTTHDLEKSDSSSIKHADIQTTVVLSDASTTGADVEAPLVVRASRRLMYSLSRWGVEIHGITPIPAEDRRDTRMYQMFFLWFSANANIMQFSAGSVGPAFFNIGLRDSLVIIVLTDLIVCVPTAFSAVFGPKLGTRSMVLARFSWGYYGTALPSLLNVLSMEGYLIINSIVGGQALASVSPHLNDTLGIVIIALISLAVTFCGYKVLHWYELVAWIPNVVAFIVMLAVGGGNLARAPVTSTTPLTPAAALSFMSSLTANVVSWSTITPDYGVYHSGDTSTLRIFTYTYLGFLLGCLIGHTLGAAFAAAASSVPVWQAGFGNGNDVGGLFEAVLSPTRGFGKLLTVLVALSMPSACAPTMYTVCTSFMTIAPVFARIPRFLIAIVSTGILIPVAIVGVTHFYNTFLDIISVIGYWICPWVAIIYTEHFVFRRSFSNYDLAQWDRARLLPPGIAALSAFVIALGLVVPFMSQTWYTGPIAKAKMTGDIGIPVGSAAAALVYAILRKVEIAVFCR